MIRIGIDTGGTFTDLVMLGRDCVFVHKARSTPDDPSRAILAGIQEIGGGAMNAEVVHGSTVATNAVLERKGARVALVATAGFEDVVRIGRQTRRELYNLMQKDRVPLVEPTLTFGVAERVAADGTVLQAPDPASVAALAARLRDAGVQAVAVCLLHSYRNPSHERAIAETIEAPGLMVSASSRILREYREYERWSTTIVNAYVTRPATSRARGTASGQSPQHHAVQWRLHLGRHGKAGSGPDHIFPDRRPVSSVPGPWQTWRDTHA